MLPLNQQVRIYFNLHKKLLSVQAKVDGRWKVVAHVEDAYVRNATFKVSEAGRQRVIKEKRKNVHAYILGELEAEISYLSDKPFHPVRYNPYETNKFQCQGESIDRAEEVILHGKRVFAAL